MGKKKIILDHSNVNYPPQYPINPVYNTELSEVCMPELLEADPCLYLNNEQANILETEASKQKGETQVGMASFYDHNLDGECTSVKGYFNPDKFEMQEDVCRPFDSYDYFVASRKYAPGTVLEVTDLSTWRSMYVVVGDYGPNERFGKETKAFDRVIDLPLSVYFRLHGDFAQGTFPVMTRVVSEPVIKSVVSTQPVFVSMWAEEFSVLPMMKGLYEITDGETLPPKIEVGTTNYIDALTILFDLVQKYPGHVYFEYDKKVHKKGESAWIKDKMVVLKSAKKLHYYKVGITPITGEGSWVIKSATDYLATKTHWPKKLIKVETGK